MSSPGCVRGTLIAGRSSRTPYRPRETREPPRFWRFRAASARPFRAPCPANLLSRRKKAEATSDAPLSLAGWRDSRRTAAARSSRTTPGSRCSSDRDSLAASSHGSTFRRANADINVERHPVLLLADQRDKKLIEFMLEEE